MKSSIGLDLLLGLPRFGREQLHADFCQSLGQFEAVVGERCEAQLEHFPEQRHSLVSPALPSVKVSRDCEVPAGVGARP